VGGCPVLLLVKGERKPQEKKKKKIGPNLRGERGTRATRGKNGNAGGRKIEENRSDENKTSKKKGGEKKRPRANIKERRV